MKKLAVIAVALLTLLFVGCESGNKTAVENGSGIKVTVYTASCFRNKTETAAKWAEENVDLSDSELCQRSASDVYSVGDTVYLSVYSVESNEMAENISCQLEKYVNGDKTVLCDFFEVGPYGDFPISVVKDGENTLLSVFGSYFVHLSTWGDSGKIIVTYSDGTAEAVEYSFTDEQVTKEMLAGREDKGFLCEFIHPLVKSEIASMVFISGEDRHTGVTTRLFELDENYKIVSARVVNGYGTFDEESNSYVFESSGHMYPEIFG